jgi:quinol monooxygenase YgiN
MIVIHVQVQVKAEKIIDFVDAAKRDTLTGQAFAGCRAYQWAENLSSPHTFILYEEWETREAFEAFKQSDYFKNTGAVLMPLLDGAPGSHYYNATLLEG